jgi:hypothetical protein
MTRLMPRHESKTEEWRSRRNNGLDKSRRGCRRKRGGSAVGHPPPKPMCRQQHERPEEGRLFYLALPKFSLSPATIIRLSTPIVARSPSESLSTDMVDKAIFARAGRLNLSRTEQWTHRSAQLGGGVQVTDAQRQNCCYIASDLLARCRRKRLESVLARRRLGGSMQVFCPAANTISCASAPSAIGKNWVRAHHRRRGAGGAICIIRDPSRWRESATLCRFETNERPSRRPTVRSRGAPRAPEPALVGSTGIAPAAGHPTIPAAGPLLACSLIRSVATGDGSGSGRAAPAPERGSHTRQSTGFQITANTSRSSWPAARPRFA